MYIYKKVEQQYLLVRLLRLAQSTNIAVPKINKLKKVAFAIKNKRKTL